MSEPAVDLFENVRPITLRNRCAAGCGREYSSAGQSPAVMIPDIGLVCANCVSAGAAQFVDEYPHKVIPIPFYKTVNS